MEASAAPDIHFVERRRYVRLVGDFDVDIVLLSGQKAGDQVAGKIANVSREGVGVVMPPNIQGGDQLNFIIYTDEDSSICDGKVIWKREVKGRLVYGVKILHWTYMDAGLERSLPRSWSLTFSNPTFLTSIIIISHQDQAH